MGELKNASPYVELTRQCAEDPACDAAYPTSARSGAAGEAREDAPSCSTCRFVVNPPLTFALPPVLTQIDADFFIRMAAIDKTPTTAASAQLLPRIIKAVEEEDVDSIRSSSLAAPCHDRRASAPPRTR
ncbi:MAG: hypothetical protein U0869_11710 [Chloroflexota bacterium]